MTPTSRLKVVVGLLTLSTIYALLVGWNIELARAIAVGYCGLMLTALVLISCWKKPPT